MNEELRGIPDRILGLARDVEACPEAGLQAPQEPAPAELPFSFPFIPVCAVRI